MSIARTICNSAMYTSKKQQQGAALIVVLMIVLLLAIAGAIAVRGSQTSLDLTTSAQVSQLLMQSSDVPLAHLENAQDKAYSTSLTQLDAMDDENGPIGFLRVNGSNTNFDGAEYILCYQPTLRKGLYAGKNDHLVIKANANSTSYGRLKNSNGYCQLDNNNAYTSKRGVVATQVSMTRPTLNNQLLEGNNVATQDVANTTKDADGNTVTTTESRKIKTYANQTFQGVTGTDAQLLGMGTAGGSPDGSVQIRAYVTSVIPSLAISSKLDNIKACLNLPIGGLARVNDSATTNQKTCISSTDTPYNIQVQDYMFVEQPAVAVAPAVPAPAAPAP